MRRRLQLQIMKTGNRPGDDVNWWNRKTDKLHLVVAQVIRETINAEPAFCDFWLFRKKEMSLKDPIFRVEMR
ncbi:hypothetical protein TNCV_4160371 [Trichonephila clavipes]|nr:hypothetical protein TNCV_4160371 [Trichonephila clavipes]